jgi:hypothetical protein
MPGFGLPCLPDVAITAVPPAASRLNGPAALCCARTFSFGALLLGENLYERASMPLVAPYRGRPQLAVCLAGKQEQREYSCQSNGLSPVQWSREYYEHDTTVRSPDAKRRG